MFIALFQKKIDVYRQLIMKIFFIEFSFFAIIFFVKITIDQNLVSEIITIDLNSKIVITDLNLKIVIENSNHDLNLNLVIDSINQKIILNVNRNLNLVDLINRKIVSDINFDFVLNIVMKNIDFDRIFETDTSKKKRNHKKFESYYRFSNFHVNFVKLKSTKMMKFDFEITFVIFFVRKFNQIIEIEKFETVFRILSMCMKKAALKWHTNLSIKIKKKMNDDFWIWKNELLRKYRFDRFVFRKKAENFVYRFDEFLIFNQYFSRKINLLYNAEITKKNIMIQYLWNKLEFHLQTTISRKKNDDILKNFEKRVRQNETTVRKIHEFYKKNRYEKFFFKNRYENKNRYNKIFFKNQKSNNFSFDCINKFLKKFIKNDLIWIRIKKIEIVFKNVSSTSKKRLFFWFCKFCNDFHWNNDYFKKNFKKKIKKMLLNIIKKKDDDTILNDENKKTYEAFQKMIYRVIFDFDFSTKSKNEY